MTLLARDLAVWAAAVEAWAPALRGGRGICRTCLTSPFTSAAGFGSDDIHEIVHLLVISAIAVADELVAEYEEAFRLETDVDEYLDESAEASAARWRIYRLHAQTLVCREMMSAQWMLRSVLDTYVENRVAEYGRTAVSEIEDWRLSQ